jgi:hypothetical protein
MTIDEDSELDPLRGYKVFGEFFKNYFSLGI